MWNVKPGATYTRPTILAVTDETQFPIRVSFRFDYPLWLSRACSIHLPAASSGKPSDHFEPHRPGDAAVRASAPGKSTGWALGLVVQYPSHRPISQKGCLQIDYLERIGAGSRAPIMSFAFILSGGWRVELFFSYLVFYPLHAACYIHHFAPGVVPPSWHPKMGKKLEQGIKAPHVHSVQQRRYRPCGSVPTRVERVNGIDWTSPFPCGRTRTSS